MKIKKIYDLKKAWKERSSISSDYGNTTILANINDTVILLKYEKIGNYYTIIAQDKNITLYEQTIETLSELKKNYKNIVKELSKGNL